MPGPIRKIKYMSVYSEFEVDITNPNSSWTIIYNLIENNKKVLDIGCSSGYFAKKLKDDKNNIVDGVELDSDDAVRAAKNCRTVVLGNIEDESLSLKALDTDYDYILFIDVLEHLIDPASALKRASKMLAKNGKIIVSIPNMANGSVRLQLLQGNFDYEKEGLLDATHLHYYTGAEIQKMIQRSGLVATGVDYTTFNVDKKTIHDVLSKVGLSSSADFYRFINKADALVYQYIVQIGKSGKKVKLVESNGDIKPKIDYERQLAEVQKDSRGLYEQKVQKDLEINALHERIEDKDKEIEKLKTALNRRYLTRARSKAGKVYRKIRKG